MPKFDLGHKPGKPTEEVKEVQALYYPSINISSEDAEGLELKMGEKVKLDAVVTGIHVNEDGKKKRTDYNIDIKTLNKGYSKKEYLNMSDEDKDEYDEKGLKE